MCVLGRAMKLFWPQSRGGGIAPLAPTPVDPPLAYMIIQEAQLMLTNLRDAFGGQSRSSNIVPYHMLGLVSYCAIVTLSLRYSTSKMP